MLAVKYVLITVLLLSGVTFFYAGMGHQIPAVGFWDARVVGGRHRTWRVLQSTKSLGAVTNGATIGAGPPSRSAPRERPRRLSARPDPPEVEARRRAP